MHQVSIFIDFDGTITTVDIGATMLQNYSGELWRLTEEKVRTGELTIREGLIEQWSRVTVGLDELKAAAMAAVVVRHGFVDFIRDIVAAGIHAEIVSDGLDLYVKTTLAQILDGTVPDWREGIQINCNKAGHSDHIVLAYPTDCDHGCALCKIGKVQQARENGGTVVYIGDGISDWKASADAAIVFAVEGISLASHLDGDTIPNERQVFEFTTFDEIRTNPVWTSILGSSRV